MPRTSRIAVGGEIYHVINRANGRLQIFGNSKEYQLFEELLFDTKDLFDMRILAYVIMPNHWHLLLYPIHDGDLSLFMQRLSNTHTRKVHSHTNTNGSGHLYQGRYKSFLVESDQYLLTLIKYIERNPVRAKLVMTCEEWQWGSAYKRLQGTVAEKKLLSELPIELPKNYREWINEEEKEEIITGVRNSVIKSMPYGGEDWTEKMINIHNLQSTTRAPGRPKNPL